MSVESYRSSLGSDLDEMVSAFDYISRRYDIEEVAVQVEEMEPSVICTEEPDPEQIEDQFLTHLRGSQMPPEGVSNAISIKSIISSGKSYEHTTGITDLNIEGRAEVLYNLANGDFEVKWSDNPAKYSTKTSWEDKLEKNLRIAEQKI